MPSIEGTYQRKSGRGLAYTYRVDWRKQGGILVYDASVWREGRLIGSPQGQMRRDPAQAEQSIRRAIESSIEAIAAE